MLISAKMLAGYKIEVSDGRKGNVEHLTVDPEPESSRVLLSTDRTERCDWPESRISVDLDREAVKACPSSILRQP